MASSTGGIARVDTARSFSTTPHDDLRLPDGRKIGQVQDATSVLVALGIPGTSHENGRGANIDAYVGERERVRLKGADAAEREWLEQLGAKA